MTIMAAPDVRPFMSTTGHALVLGGPGSGKTTLALRKAIARIAAGLDSGQAILFLSFSRAAVARLVQAGREQVPKEHRSALNVQTFHGFCWNVLSCHAYLLGAPHRITILMPHDERAIRNGIKADHPDWPAWISERERLFFEEGRIAFDLFAEMTLRLLRQSTEISRLLVQQFPMIIVDEAQDTGTDAWEIVKHLKSLTQTICLADPEQQIFDYLPGVGPERIEAIRAELLPLELDLGQQNNRSPGTDIAAFGNDLIRGANRGVAYNGVSRLSYDPRGIDLNLQLRKAIAIAYRGAKKLGVRPESCAIIASTGSEVAQITAALSNGARPVAHKVVFDEAVSLLASRFAAFCLEPKLAPSMTQHVVESLELYASIAGAAGTGGGIKLAGDCRRWAAAHAGGAALPVRSLGAALRQMFQELHNGGFTGDPRTDWLRVKSAFRACRDGRIQSLAAHLDYLVAFGRGQFLAAGLLDCWTRSGNYTGARLAFDTAIAQDSILESSQELTGIHVMNVHRAKGKQFDAVVLFRKGVRSENGWRSSFVWRDDANPYPRSRKILRVAVTRARKHVLIMDPIFPACPLLAGYRL
jgi:DNA helicase II / ATP-dependent DNA helicase PcrA